MADLNAHRRKVAGAYHKFAGGYDRLLRAFDLMAPFGFDLNAWRQQAVDALELKPGDTVVDVGCGTGANLPLLRAAVGPEGHVIGVDLSSEMLRHAKQRADDEGWDNVDLVCMDAGGFAFPKDVDGVLATWSLILIPAADEVVARACEALRPGGRLSVMDMRWPDNWPHELRHVFFWLGPLGVDADTLRRRPWVAIHDTAEARLDDVRSRRFWYDMMYRLAGTKAPGEHTLEAGAAAVGAFPGN